MKLKWFLITGCIIPVLALTGCAVLKKPVQLVDRFIGSTLFPPYSGPKASVVVADFEIKTANLTTEVNTGLRDMLIEGLNKTNRFLAVSAPKDHLENNAGLIIAVEVTNFDPLISGGSEGVGGGGSAASGTLGSLLGVVTNKSTIVLNIRVVDAASSKVLFSERLSGQGVDSESLRRGRQNKETSLNESLSAYANTPMEEAIDKCIMEAVRYIAQKVPANYYREDKNGKAQTQGKT
ncbi:MAG: CsgG/HfaB family protein [Candidatus Omnitrophota bacterium]|nr:CsgG/HfaB family protein [Candidatus Omnitrophota bacterium]